MPLPKNPTPFRPRALVLRASPLTRNRRLDLSQHDGLDSPARLRYFAAKTRGCKGKGSPDSITERRVPELIPVLGSQPAGDVSHKPGGRLPILSVRLAATPATLKRTATNFAAW